MKPLSCRACLLLLLSPVISSATRDCTAQSTVISLDTGHEVSAAPVVMDLVQSNVPPQVRRLESLLAQPTPGSWPSGMTFGQLIAQLKQAGVPTVVHASTPDNGLDDRSPVTLVSGLSIADNLNYAMREYDCAYSIEASGAIRLASAEVMEELLTHVVYNVTSVAGNLDELQDLLLETIDPDSWEENGGNGRLMVSYSTRRQLLTIAQTYQNQLRIRRYLSDIVRMGGGAGGLAGVQYRGFSSSVELPDAYLTARQNRRGMALPGSGMTGAFGGGGFGGGLGGGVF